MPVFQTIGITVLIDIYFALSIVKLSSFHKIVGMYCLAEAFEFWDFLTILYSFQNSF